VEGGVPSASLLRSFAGTIVAGERVRVRTRKLRELSLTGVAVIFGLPAFFFWRCIGGYFALPAAANAPIRFTYRLRN
jgi:hypothetical protein